MNDEKILRRLAKKFRTIATLAQPAASSGQSVEEGSKPREELLAEARETFLLDLDMFQMMLIKNAQICEAEARMVSQYDTEKERIAHEHNALLQDIGRLKVELSEAQILRKRKMEYDAIAEKINALPSRMDLEIMVARHEEELAVARAEQAKLKMEMQTRKTEFDAIVSAVQDIRTRGLDQNDVARMNEGVEGEAGEIDAGGTSDAPDGHSKHLNPNAKPFLPLSAALPISRPSTPQSSSTALNNPTSIGNTLTVPSALHRGDTRSARSSPGPSPPTNAPSPSKAGGTNEADDDIEMGEVAEDDLPHSTPNKVKRPPRGEQELEEGEASDDSSDLSSVPEGFV
ncbi:hypothetical protein FRB99_008717 [Tulasnella sp. 403]|nr:hypothetical protein FRB99_008717 [Tulasnella sp. 403]